MPTFEALPGPQSLLIACPFEDVLYGGARGGAKSWGLILDFLSHADEYGEHAKGLLIRRTYPELEELEARCAEIFPSIGARYMKQARTWVGPRGSRWRLKLRHLKNQEDAGHYQGHEYTWIGADEVGNYAHPAPLDMLWATLREGAHSPGVKKYFRLTANPGGRGHNWLKARYVDPAPPYTPFADPKTGIIRAYLPATLDDNPELLKRDPDYWRRVTAAVGGNKALLRAWRLGDWNIVAGGMFDDLWGTGSNHVLSPWVIPSSWTVTRAFDWGSSRPFSVGWWAQSDGTEAPNGRTYPPGSLIRVMEWYGAAPPPALPNEGIRMSPTAIAKEIVKRERDCPWLAGHVVQPGPADSSIFTAEYGKSIADEMKEAGVKWLPADKRPGSRIVGWSRMRSMLEAAAAIPRELPGLWVFDTCRDFIRTVPVLPRDEVKIEDVDTDAEDHIGDETRYRVMFKQRARTGGELALG